MSKKPKIALCWTGQTRTYNNPISGDHIRKSHTEIFKDCDVHHYGHTWNDCDPPIDRDKFIFFKSQDQSVIDEFVTKEEMPLRFIVKESWYSRSDWKNMSPKERVLHTLSMQKAIYGQIWSFLECYKSIPDYSQYDFIVKTRWDTGYNFYDNTPVWPVDTTEEEYYQLFRNYIKDLYITPPVDEIFATNNIDKIKNSPTFFQSSFNDHIFIIRTKGRFTESLKNLNVEEIVDLYIKKSQKYTNHSYDATSHTAWKYFFQSLDVGILEILPNIFSCVGDWNKDAQKVWDI